MRGIDWEGFMMANKYDWKITAKKFGWSFLQIVVVGFIAYATETPELLVFVPIAEAVKNFIKHYKN